jgi:hypothetical protein
MCDPARDPQREAFHDNPYPTTDYELDLLAETTHPAGTGPALLPGDWDAIRWDSERVGPKTPAEARAALEARIADPLAPDTAEHVGVYDEEI